MPLELFWLLLLLPVAAWSGWFAARRSERRAKRRERPRIPDADYLRGLNYFLDDRPDKAVDLFVRVLDVNEETVETHLALGSVFRRRGEVDRAIQIHQNLVARTSLSNEQRARALLELGEDYMRSGLLDRAEGLFGRLLNFPAHEGTALHNLSLIHQQERGWLAAIDDCRRLEEVTGRSLRTEIAHFYCELAIESRQEGDASTAGTLLEQALLADPACARALLMSARLAIKSGLYERAEELLKCVEQRTPSFTIEIITPLRECFEARGRLRDLLDYLLEVLNRHPSGRLTIVIADLFHELDLDESAPEFLKRTLATHPSLSGLRKLLQLIAGKINDNGELASAIELGHSMLDGDVHYRCKHCGFQGRSLHWRCPGCQNWSSVEPRDQERLAVVHSAATLVSR